MAGIAYVVAAYFMTFRMIYKKQKAAMFLKTCLKSSIGILIGGYIAGMIVNVLEAAYSGHILDIKYYRQLGFVAYGGLFGFLTLYYTFMYRIAKSYQIDKGIWLDIVGMGMPLFHAIARWGCFFAGCCYGKQGQFLFTVTYLGEGKVPCERIPVQVLESIGLAGIFVFLCWCQWKQKLEGKKLQCYLGMYAALRFCLEFLRGDEVRGVFWGISYAQFISIFILCYFVFRRYVKWEKRLPMR